MTFRKKVVLWFMALILVITSAFSVFYYSYSSNQMVQKAYNQLQASAQVSSNQLDETLKSMEHVVSSILSDQSFLNANTTLVNLNRDTQEKKARILLAKRDVSSTLHSYYYISNFYGIKYFNALGDFVSNSSSYSDIQDGNVTAAFLVWLPQKDDTFPVSKGVTLIPPHDDPWETGTVEQVFSVLKTIQGNTNRGYIEVQKKAEDLERIYSYDSSLFIDVIAVKANGDVLYSSFEPDLQDYYKSIALGNQSFSKPVTRPHSNEKEIISVIYSEYSDTYTCLVNNEQGWSNSSHNLIYQIIIIAILVMLLSFVYISVAANLLTKPIRELKHQIEVTSIDNIEKTVDFQSSNHEVQSLKNAYTDLIDRLKTALIRENDSASLQIQAQMDALQAQIDPHFIFNILNVISYHGVKNNGEIISDICDNLASMLRYSTNTSSASASIRQEIGYVQNYITLLEHRYENKIKCNINMDHELLPITIPKVTLQQFVENAINHGYENTEKDFEITITGTIKQGHWSIVILDYGEGISHQKLEQLKDSLHLLKIEFFDKKIRHKMEIGGMGILNTYARLLIYFDGKVDLTVESEENVFTKITICGELEGE